MTPSSYAFWIWTLIHFLLLGFVIYQFTDKGKAIIVDRIHYRFALLGVFNILFLNLFYRGWYILAFVASLFVAAAVSQIYYIINLNDEGGLANELFVHLPFSLYHGCEYPTSHP